MFGVPQSDTDEAIVILIDSDKKYSSHDFYRLLEKGKYSIDSYALPQHIFF
jgi:hypothetical protein